MWFSSGADEPPNIGDMKQELQKGIETLQFSFSFERFRSRTTKDYL